MDTAVVLLDEQRHKDSRQWKKTWWRVEGGGTIYGTCTPYLERAADRAEKAVPPRRRRARVTEVRGAPDRMKKEWRRISMGWNHGQALEPLVLSKETTKVKCPIKTGKTKREKPRVGAVHQRHHLGTYRTSYRTSYRTTQPKATGLSTASTVASTNDVLRHSTTGSIGGTSTENEVPLNHFPQS